MPFEIIRLATIDSTSSEALRRLEAGAAGGFAIVADRQTAGRGSHGRNWHSPAGNLYVSIATAPDVPASRAGELAFVGAVAAAEAIASFIDPATVRLKWPNDVLANDAKICGILTETRLEGKRIGYGVTGIGVNVLAVPDKIDYPVTSMQAEGATAARDDVLDVLLARFDHWYMVWLRTGFAPVRERWMALAWRLDESISIVSASRTATGTFKGIDEAGALVLHETGGLTKFTAGSMGYRPINRHHDARL